MFPRLTRILKGEPSDPTMDEARAAYLAVKACREPPPGAALAALDMGGVPAALAAPEDGRVLFDVHGD